MQSLSSALDAKRRFTNRSEESIEKLLIGKGMEGEPLAAAMMEWQNLAKAYEIDCGKLRPDDSIADLVKTDWFGDRGLMIEARLTRRGVKSIPENMTIFELILLLSSK